MTHSPAKARAAKPTRITQRSTDGDHGMTRRDIASLIGVALGVAVALVPAGALAARNSSGTFSINPGAGTYPFVTGTAISSTTVNTILNDVASGLTDSLSRTGKGAMTSPLQCPDGNAGLPAFTFANDATSGLYRIGANDLGLSVGGVKRWEHTAAGQTETGWLEVAGTTTVGGAATFSSTLSSGAITAPSVTSSGAKLALTAPATFDVEISASATLGFVVKADGTNDNKSRKLVNVTDPTSAQDAATKNYVDTRTNTRIVAFANVSSAGSVVKSYLESGFTGFSISRSGAGAYSLRINTTPPAGTYYFPKVMPVAAAARSVVISLFAVNGADVVVYDPTGVATDTELYVEWTKVVGVN